MGRFFLRRMARGPFWLLVLANIIAATAIQRILATAMRHAAGGPLHSQLVLQAFDPKIMALLYAPSLVAASWRLHDTGRSGALAWIVLFLKAGIVYVLTGFVLALSPLLKSAPDVGAITAVYGGLGVTFFIGALMLRLAYLCAKPSDLGTNRYGPPPGHSTMPGGDSPDDSALETPVIYSAPAPRPAVQRKSVTSGKPTFGRRAH